MHILRSEKKISKAQRHECKITVCKTCITDDIVKGWCIFGVSYYLVSISSSKVFLKPINTVLIAGVPKDEFIFMGDIGSEILENAVIGDF